MSKPNILFLMTDQQRWDAMSTNGDWVDTPHLDRIAAEGTRFTQCITTTPICVPARMTLATGRYPHNNGVWSNLHDASTPRALTSSADAAIFAMPPDANNWMREIRDLGYRTSLFGKTHLHPHVGDLRDKEDLLHAWGLDDVDEIGGPRASASVMSHMTAMWEDKGLLEAYRADFKERFSNKPHVARASVLPLADYADVYVGQKARHYLESYNRDEPWFCWVSFGGPHEPWDAPEPYASRYDPNTMPEPIVDVADEPPRPEGYLDYARKNNYWGNPTFEEGDIGAMRANYAGNVSLIDDQIGEVLAVIEARGEMDNTLIAFTSDHGEMNGDHGLIYKMNFYDGALRVPLVIRSPGENGGRVNDSLVEMCDVGPTLVELAGGTIEYRQFARSLVGAMQGGRHREDCLSEFMGEFMLINEDWKVALNRQGLPYLLFDRRNDPTETRNLAGMAEYKADADGLRLRILERISQSQLKEYID